MEILGIYGEDSIYYITHEYLTLQAINKNWN